MDDLAERVAELNTLIKELKFEEAFDKFYDEHIVTHENEEPPIVGLEDYKKAGKIFLENISNYRAELKNVIISHNMSVVDWHYKFEHKMAGLWDRHQLSLQRWKNGKIVHERHHWNP